MRIILVLVVFCLLPIPAAAQESHRLRSARGHQVAVIDADSREWQGRLLEIARDAIVVEIDSTPHRFELSAVKRVDAHGDRVWDGAIKGVVFGAIMASVLIGPRYAPGSAAIYGLIGLGADALNSCHHTVYRTPAQQASVKISW
jgi:hypothetical protein